MQLLTANGRFSRHFEEMTAPDRPMAGAFAALRLLDGLSVKDGFEFVETGGAGPHPVGGCHFFKPLAP